MKLSTYLFWDTDIKNIDWEKYSGYVIERVITRGKLDDWKKIVEFYGMKKIKNEILSIRYLDKKTFNFFSVYFNIPKENFRCYTMKQLFPGHWDF